MAKKMTKKNAYKVLAAIGERIREGGPDAKVLLYQMNEMLDGLSMDDFWGTDGRLDPRGDRRGES